MKVRKSRMPWPAVMLRLLLLLAVLLLMRLDARPTAPVEYQRLAMQALQLGDPALAMEALSQAIAYYPYDPDLLSLYAEASLRAADYTSVLSSLESLEALRPLEPREIGLRGSAYGGLGQFDAARRDWEQAWRSGGIDPQALADLSRLYLAAGDWQTARRAMEAFSSVAADPALNWQLTLIEALEDRSAASVSLELLLDDPTHAARARQLQALVDDAGLQGDGYYLRLGLFLLNQQSLSLAAEAFERAYRLNPANAEALAYYAYVQQRSGIPALAASQQALSLGADRPVLHYLAGLVWALNGEVEEARAAYLNAAGLDPANPAFAVEIANTYTASGDLDLAELWHLRAAEASLGSASEREFQVLLAQFYVDSGYRVEERGLPLAEALVERAPDDARAYDALGWARMLTGNVAGAGAALDQALLLDPGLARGHFHRARVYETESDVQRAIWHYQQALLLDPNGVHGKAAQEALTRLGG